MASEEISGMSIRGGSNVAAIMPKIAAAVTARSRGTKIDLASAENWLIRPEIIEICKEAIVNNLCPGDLSYPRAFAGFPEVLDAFAMFLNTYFKPLIPVEVSHLATAPGAASCIDTLLYNICDPGDGILVPGAYWSGFDFQFKARSSVIPVSVVTADLDSTISEALIPALEVAFEKSEIPIRGMLMSNPHNPLGQCYPAKCLEECIRFCQRKNIHYISDEVYAMTTFPCPEIAEPVPFVSALSLDVASIGCDLSRVHAVWSTSKDLGQSGIRMASSIIQVQRVGNTNSAGIGMRDNSGEQRNGNWCHPSFAYTNLDSFFDMRFGNSHLASPTASTETQLRGASIGILHGGGAVLKKHKLRYFPSYAGLYVFANIAPGCESWEEEKRVVELMKGKGVIISGGQGYHGPESEKGWARIGFGVPKDQLKSALQVMDDVFKEEALHQQKDTPVEF